MLDIRETQEKVLQIVVCVDAILSKHKLWYSLSHGSALGAVRHQGFIPWDADFDIYVKSTEIEKIRTVLKNELPQGMKLLITGVEYHYYSCHDRVCYLDLPQQSVHLDIFPLIGCPDDEPQRFKFVRKCYYTYAFFSSKYKNLRYSAKKNIFPILLCKLVCCFVPDSKIKRRYDNMSAKYPLEQSEYCCILGDDCLEKSIVKKDEILSVQRMHFEGHQFLVTKFYDKYLRQLYGDYMIPDRKA